MRAAITVFGSSVSPLFDAARKLLVADVDARRPPRRELREIGDLDLPQRLALLSTLEVQLVVCGGISAFLERSLVDRGIAVCPWVAAEIDEVLELLAVRGALDPRRVVVSSANGAGAQVDPCWWSCPHLLVFECGEGGARLAADRTPSADAGPPELAAVRTIVAARAGLLLTGRCGPNGRGLLQLAGVDVVLGVEGAVQEAVERHGCAEERT